jgi:glycosyltransferase involved in cell wall biosynthesis
VEVGVDAARIAVVPHPVFPGSFRYEGDGATLLFLGVIRPYKQLEHAVEVARRLGARLIVLGDPAMDVGHLAGKPGVELRLGYRPDAELDDALAEATVAIFPYREELDQSGALLRALGAGVPAACYEVGGIAEPVRRFRAGVSVPANDLDALTEALQPLLSDPARLEQARDGARQAAAELTWDAAAASHEALYRSLLG